MKVLLTHGYYLYEDPKEQEIMRPYPPLGILCISAYLEEEGIDNEVFDATFSSFEKFTAYLLEHRPQYIGIYTNLMTKLNVLRIAEFVRDEATLKDTIVILGGPEVKYNAGDFLGFGIDYLIIGEGEQTMTELIRALDEGKRKEALNDVQGLGFITTAGEQHFTDERTKIKSINDLPMPNRKKIELEKYLEVWKEFHGQSTLSVTTMRGCPYSCKWCSRAVYGLSYRRRSPEKVVEEMVYLKKRYNPDSLWFVDDVFTVSHKWLKQFVEALNAANIRINYECITRADRLNEEVIELLKESGCFRVWIGAESGSQKIIDLMDRRVDVHTVREMIQKTQARGIQAGTFIMLGYPGETEEDIEETIHHLKTSNPDHFTITVAYPIKGTELFQEIEAIQTHNINWEKQTDRDRDFQRAYPRRYYDYAVRRVVNEVNWNKKVLAGEQLSIAGAKLKMRSTAAKLGMWWQRRGIKA